MTQYTHIMKGFIYLKSTTLDNEDTKPSMMWCEQYIQGQIHLELHNIELTVYEINTYNNHAQYFL